MSTVINKLRRNEVPKDEVTEIKVDGQIFVKKGSEEPKNSDIKIVVLQRGWVMIGRYSKDGDICTLENAYVIRIWGTTQGLGELALEGKQTNTKLDKAGHVEFHILTVVAALNCNDSKWDKEL